MIIPQVYYLSSNLFLNYLQPVHSLGLNVETQWVAEPAFPDGWTGAPTRVLWATAALTVGVAGTAPEDQVSALPIHLRHLAVTNRTAKRHKPVPEIEHDKEACHSSDKRRHADMWPERFRPVPLVKRKTQVAAANATQNGKGELQQSVNDW